MRQSPINKISTKQQKELEKRVQLKAELIKEFGEHCMTCKDISRDWRGISLSHIIPLGRAGETSKKNCLLECYVCHTKFEKHPENRPMWQQLQAGLRER